MRKRELPFHRPFTALMRKKVVDLSYRYGLAACAFLHYAQISSFDEAASQHWDNVQPRAIGASVCAQGVRKAKAWSRLV